MASKEERLAVGPEAIKAVRTTWRKAQIIAAAVKLLETQNFSQMTVSELAVEAKISVGTIYQYVDRKEDVLIMVIIDILEAYREAVAAVIASVADPVDRLRQAFRAYCEVVESHRSAVVLGYGYSRALSSEDRKKVMHLEEETTGMLADCIQYGVDAGVFETASEELEAWNLAVRAHMWALKHWHMARSLDFDSYVDAQFEATLRTIERKCQVRTETVQLQG